MVSSFSAKAFVENMNSTHSENGFHSTASSSLLSQQDYSSFERRLTANKILLALKNTLPPSDMDTRSLYSVVSGHGLSSLPSPQAGTVLPPSPPWTPLPSSSAWAELSHSPASSATAKEVLLSERANTLQGYENDDENEHERDGEGDDGNHSSMDARDVIIIHSDSDTENSETQTEREYKINSHGDSDDDLDDAENFDFILDSENLDEENMNNFTNIYDIDVNPITNAERVFNHNHFNTSRTITHNRGLTGHDEQTATSAERSVTHHELPALHACHQAEREDPREANDTEDVAVTSELIRGRRRPSQRDSSFAFNSDGDGGVYRIDLSAMGDIVKRRANIIDRIQILRDACEATEFNYSQTAKISERRRMFSTEFEAKLNDLNVPNLNIGFIVFLEAFLKKATDSLNRNEEFWKVFPPFNGIRFFTE